MSNEVDNLYSILGVNKNAEKEVIIAAYRAMAKKYHPDVWGGSESEANDKIRKLNEAFELLSDDQKREAYDHSLKNKEQGKNNKNEGYSNKIQVLKEKLPENISLKGKYLIVQNKEYLVSEIDSIEHNLTQTDHKMNFQHTHTSLESELILYFEKNLSWRNNSLTINSNSKMFSSYSRYDLQIERSEKVSYLAYLLMEVTFRKRLNKYIKNSNDSLAFSYDKYNFYYNGNITYKGDLYADINSNQTKMLMYSASSKIEFQKQGFLGKVMRESIGNKSIDFKKDRDIFLYLLKYRLGQSYQGVHVRERL